MKVVLNRIDLLPNDIISYIYEINELDKILDLFDDWFKKWCDNLYKSHSIIDIALLYPYIYMMVNLNEMIIFTTTYQKFINNKDISNRLDDFAAYIINQKNINYISVEYIRNQFYKKIKSLY